MRFWKLERLGKRRYDNGGCYSQMGFAREAADRVIFMDDGIIAERGYAGGNFPKPQNPRTKAF